MALAYAFIDETGERYGENNPSTRGVTTFPYVPASERFAGQPLTMHATSWDGFPSGTWLRASDRWGCYATIEVDELPGLEPTTP